METGPRYKVSSEELEKPGTEPERNGGWHFYMFFSFILQPNMSLLTFADEGAYIW